MDVEYDKKKAKKIALKYLKRLRKAVKDDKFLVTDIVQEFTPIGFEGQTPDGMAVTFEVIGAYAIEDIKWHEEI